MKRKVLPLRLIGVGALLVLVFGAVSPVSSQQPPPRTTLQLFEGYKGSVFKDVDVPKRGEWGGPGDYSMGVQPLYDPETCEKVGRTIGRFSIVKRLKRDDAWYIFDATTHLGTEKITLYGAAKFTDFPEGATAAVTGGTGAYTDARGAVSIGPAELCGEEGSMYTFELELRS